MQSQVEIVNMALAGFLGKPTITSMTQNGTEAALARQLYPVALREIARASDWSFLRERTALQLLSPNDRSDYWDHRYDYPSRALKLFGLVDTTADEELYRWYVIANGSIYTNLYQAHAHYTTLEDRDAADFSTDFSTAVAAKLAQYMAPTLTRRRNDVETFRALSMEARDRGIQHDAGQEHTSYAVDRSYEYGRVNQHGSTARQVDGSTIWDR